MKATKNPLYIQVPSDYKPSLPCSLCLTLFLTHTHTHIHMFTQTSAHTLTAEGRKGVSWISLYTSENWPNSPNYGITWANLIYHCNYLASASSHTHKHTQAQTEKHRHSGTHTCCDNRRSWSNMVGHLEREEERLVPLCLQILLSCSCCYLSPVISLILTL